MTLFLGGRGGAGASLWVGSAVGGRGVGYAGAAAKLAGRIRGVREMTSNGEVKGAGEQVCSFMTSWPMRSSQSSKSGLSGENTKNLPCKRICSFRHAVNEDVYGVTIAVHTVMR